MRGAEQRPFVGEPCPQRNLVRLRLRPHGQDNGEVVEDLLATGIPEAALNPLVADRDAVADKLRFVADPHQHGGMTSPSVADAGEGVEDLEGLPALFPESSLVEGEGAASEVCRVREEGQHGLTFGSKGARSQGIFQKKTTPSQAV